MLFNLSAHESFECSEPPGAIYCSKDIGPYFGYDSELSAFEPFNKENGCVSDTQKSVYNIPRNKIGINMLTNKKCNYGNVMPHLCSFTITEIEVWGVSIYE